MLRELASLSFCCEIWLYIFTHVFVEVPELGGDTLDEDQVEATSHQQVCLGHSTKQIFWQTHQSNEVFLQPRRSIYISGLVCILETMEASCLQKVPPKKLLPWEGSWTRQTRFVTSLNYMRLPAKRLDPSDLSRPYRGWSTSLELQGNGPGKMPGPHLGGGEPA